RRVLFRSRQSKTGTTGSRWAISTEPRSPRRGSLTAYYVEGLSDGWNPIQKYWREPTAENRDALRAFLTSQATKWQYLHGVTDESLVAPEAYVLDSALLARPGNHESQLNLFLDYANNVALYPKFQEYFRAKRPPGLA